jgi:FkbM family methyltransferase
MAHWQSLVGVVKHFKNWPTHVLDFLRLVPPGVMHYELRNGVKFNARSRTRDSQAIREVWIFNEYTPPGLEIGPDAVVVDVGGHIGTFTVLAARKATAGKVFVFEPTPDNFALLQQNLELNGISNVTAFNLAMLGHAGTRRLALNADQVSHSLIFGDPNLKRIDVRGISLADFVKEQNIGRIDFMKLDCEGAEFEILRECPDEVLGIIQKLSAEIHNFDDRHNRIALGEFLTSKGFTVRLDPEKRHMLYAQRGSIMGNSGPVLDNRPRG